jgi:hypothetical protein
MAMPDHAGFANAVTVREHALSGALLAPYANGSFPKVLAADLPGRPPEVAANVFLGQPEINCEDTPNLLVLTSATWGPPRVTLDSTQLVAQIAAELEVTIRPVFAPGPNLPLDGLSHVSEHAGQRCLLRGRRSDQGPVAAGCPGCHQIPVNNA